MLASFQKESSPVHSTAVRTVRCLSVGRGRTCAAWATLWPTHLKAARLSLPTAYANLHHYTAVVCREPKRRLRMAALLSEQVPVAKSEESGPYKCSGSSVDVSPVGNPRWEAKCLATGAREYPEGCGDIDWCLGTPTFSCHYASTNDGKTCVEVNECDAWCGAAACSPVTCIDRVNGFLGTCPSGYLVARPDGNEERCEREVCGSAPGFKCATQNVATSPWGRRTGLPSGLSQVCWVAPSPKVVPTSKLPARRSATPGLVG